MAHSDSHQTIQNFFNETSRISKSLPVDDFVLEPSPIFSILRPYQLETVKWMVMRELRSIKINLIDCESETPLGGILADEMGLGKTVEILACILAHRKMKKNENIDDLNASNCTNSSISSLERDEEVMNEMNSTIESESSIIPEEPSDQKHKSRKRKNSNDVPLVFKKRPSLSSIKINRTMRKKIKELLTEYFEKFKRYCTRKISFEKSIISLMDISFKIIILHRFYDMINDKYSQQQAWGFLLTEFNVDDTESVGHSILQKEMQNDTLKDEQSSEERSDSDMLKVMPLINGFLTEKNMAKFEKSFRNILAYSLLIAPGDDTVLFDGDDVACKCGSDKAQGRKIKCTKCNSFQHLQCVGLDYSFTNYQNYICPYCWIKSDVIESAATLIVIPSTLTLQWKQEIKKHAVNCNLKIRIYEGVNKDYVLPDILASYDVVIVSFETLRAELNYASEIVDKNTRSLRHNKRYLIFGSPLTCISWWRLCIDEAQMVESSNHVSEMVSHLKSIYRWAITGTPVGKSLKDLFGLTTFLGVKPFCNSYFSFQNLLCGDQSSLHTLFAYLMRRNTKNEVRQQLNLPNLDIETNWLSFSPVEGYFYQYTHSMAEKTFMQKIKKINNLNQRLSKACRRTAESVLTPLVTLRQACVHPQAVNKECINLSKTMTMEKLLEQLIKKTKTECEDILRLYIMNIHGAAGVKIDMAQFSEAVHLYKTVLSKIDEFEHLTIDDFQILHAKHNLYEAASKDKGIILTAEEQKIPEQIIELEQKYIQKRREPVTILLQNVEKHSTEIGNYLQDFRLGSFDWWSRMLNGLEFDELKSRITSELDKMNLTLDNLRVLLSTEHRLSSALQYWLGELEDKRMLIHTFLEKITKITSVSTLCDCAVECHLRQAVAKNTCSLCKMEKVMINYENILFNGKIKKKQETNNENLNPLDWKMSAYECILTAILNHARALLFHNNQIARAADHLKVLGLLKREFKTIRATWTKQSDLVHGYDELAMAKSRFDAICGSTDKLNNENPLYQGQFDTYEAASIVAYSKLQAKMGSLQYLMNLKKNYSDQGITNECCPVCQLSADERRGVMSCGHFTCCLCMINLIKRSTTSEILCPICRSTVKINNVTYVHGGGHVNVDMGEIRGNYSVKIGAITSKVLRLRQQDSEIKILIFSTWDRVLDVIEQALKENGVKFQRFIGGRKQNSRMKMFQENKDVTALLIPLRSGGKGLNLTEASHIIFAEPVLSIADEKQAIGRIDRLGQTRNMVIHKFIMRSTIEQHLLMMNEELQKNNAETIELTFKDLKEIFIASTNDIDNNHS